MDLSPALLITTMAAYIGLLFWIARKGDQSRFHEGGWSRHPVVYGLALGVYCTSWTFYGLVGTASVSTWQFIPILLGPILMFSLGSPVLERIFRICKQEHIHSIADFIASRYGKRQGIAASVTMVVLLATVPYISLQLKAVSDTLSLLIGSHVIGHQDLTLLIAAAMICFALLFGAKQLDVSGYHGGLMGAIAFESVVKLLALIMIASFATYWLFFDLETVPNWQTQTEESRPVQLGLRFFVEVGLSACAIFCLPRMFHVGFVECISEKHLRSGRIIFPLYLIVIGVCIYFIAKAGNQMFFSDIVRADTYVIAIPLAQESQFLTILAFIGGFSAATAMIIVATITLSQMLSNDVILPFILRRNPQNAEYKDYSRSLIFTRRITVALVVIFAYLYQVVLTGNAALTSIGLIAFALSVHLAPALLMGLYSRKSNAKGVYAGLLIGLSIWAYMLMLPLLADAGLFNEQALINGPGNVSWLSPYTLFGFSFSDHFTRSVIISLICNWLAIVLFSQHAKTTLADRIQAAAFTSHDAFSREEEAALESIPVADLKELIRQFVGSSSAQKLFEGAHETALADPDLVERARKALSGIVGVASSQSMIDSIRTGRKLAVEDVVNIFGETTKALRFNQEILFSSFENVSSGISVVNKELDIVAWNQRYEEMFNYPKGMLQIGFPVSELVRFNAERGLLGAGSIDELVQKRLTHLHDGKPYRVVRQHHDNHVIEIKGTPLPDGGYVTTYDDITDFIATQRELEQSNLHLEQRVQQRTAEIEAINGDLRKEIELRKSMETELLNAKALAEAANATKSRFLALASHDILQPINAAQLYINSILEHNEERRDQSTLNQVKAAVTSAETIISSLLEIARLDTNAMRPNIAHFDVDNILKPLVREFEVQLHEGVRLKYVPCSLAIESDQSYFRRIVQNFLSNAVKYTQQGKIVVGCRRRGAHLEVCVLDTGPGISAEEQRKIFTDFYRVSSQSNISGLGLGLAVTSRLAEILGHALKVRSTPGQGSSFSVLAPLGATPRVLHRPESSQTDNDLKGLKVAYVDDGAENLNATEKLLARWSCEMQGFLRPEDALTFAESMNVPDVLLMDYQLNDEDYNGIVLANRMLEVWQDRVPVCIVSAAAEPELPDFAKGHGFEFLSKPVKPAKLRALLNHIASKRS